MTEERHTPDGNGIYAPYVAIDNGGTKALGVRFGDDFIPVSKVKTGSLRGNTNPKETVEKRIDEIVNGLGFVPGDVIESVTGTFPRSLVERMKKTLTVREERYLMEVEPGLAAAELFGDALLAICGTGVSVFSYYKGKTLIFGGYGSLVADEGSGYWIAREALGACIRDYEGRGPATLLTEAVAEKLGSARGMDFRDAVFSIYKRNLPSLVTEIASITPVVVEIAKKDEVAAGILRSAGRLVAEQLAAVARKSGAPEGIPVGISGSVWKKNPVFFGAFKEALSRDLPGSEIVIPAYEPIAGIVMHMMAEKNGKNGFRGLTAENKEVLKKYYRDYEFTV
ncbi:MAG: hypothetical protein IJS71_08585 [Clostridia bacterium]|nr:hypothetical protein [Clostridia bacterium]